MAPTDLRDAVLEWLAADSSRSNKAAAEMFGVKLGTVKSWKSRAKRAAQQGSKPPGLTVHSGGNTKAPIHTLPPPASIASTEEGPPRAPADLVSDDDLTAQQAMVDQVWSDMVLARSSHSPSPAGITKLWQLWSQERDKLLVLRKAAETERGLTSLSQGEWFELLDAKYADAPIAELERAVMAFCTRTNSKVVPL